MFIAGILLHVCTKDPKASLRNEPAKLPQFWFNDLKCNKYAYISDTKLTALNTQRTFVARRCHAFTYRGCLFGGTGLPRHV